MRFAKNEETPGALEAVRGRLEQWRREHGGRGRKIPQELWGQAARVAEIVGTEETARALRLDERRLQAQLGTLEPSFVEVGGVGELSPGGATVVEIENRFGDRMRVAIAAAGLPTVVQLVEALLGARP